MKKVLHVDYWPAIDPLQISGNGLASSLFKLTVIANNYDRSYSTDLLTSPLKKELLDGAYGIGNILTSTELIDFESYNEIMSMGILEDELISKPQVKFHAFAHEHRNAYKNTPHISFWRHYN